MAAQSPNHVQTTAQVDRYDSIGADCDSWAALQDGVNAVMGACAGRVACRFFTYGPNSLRCLVHIEGGRDDYYSEDQKTFAKALKIE